MNRQIKYLVLHHTGGSIKDTRDSIDRYQKSTGKYTEIAYNWFLDYEGCVSVGRDIKSNAANLGLNSISVSYCLAGNFDKVRPSIDQQVSLRWSIKLIMERHNIKLSHLILHNMCPNMPEFNSKDYVTSCAGVNFVSVYHDLRDYLKKVLPGHLVDI